MQSRNRTLKIESDEKLEVNYGTLHNSDICCKKTNVAMECFICVQFK